jgi:hypothetical protein
VRIAGLPAGDGTPLVRSFAACLAAIGPCP